MNADDERKSLEWEILKVIREKLEQGEMDSERASQIAKLVLKTIHPGMSLQEIYKIVPTLDDQFTELSIVVLPILKEYEEKIEKKVQEHVRTLIKQGKFSEASTIAEQVIKKDTSLSTQETR